MLALQTDAALQLLQVHIQRVRLLVGVHVLVELLQQSALAEAARRLRARGYDTLNPTQLPPSRWLWNSQVLGYRLTLLYDLWHLMLCDGITMLAGWEQSRGARLAKATADIFNITEITIEICLE